MCLNKPTVTKAIIITCLIVPLFGDNLFASATNNEKPDHPLMWWLTQQEVLQNTIIFPAHILIRHNQSVEEGTPLFHGGWDTLGPAPERSLEEAMALAKKITEEINEDPSKFQEYVKNIHKIV